MPEEVPVEELWNKRVAPQLGLSPNATLLEAPVRLGAQTYSVESPEGFFTLRSYAPRSLSRLRKYLEAAAYYKRIGFRTPEIIGQGKDREGAWLLERQLAGRSFRELVGDPAATRSAAAALARLHSHERNRYGEVETWGGFRLPLRWRQRFLERWSKVIRLFPELKPVGGAVETWFQTWTDSFSPSRYQLLHGDFQPGNLCLLGDLEVAFQEFRLPRFGFGLLELLEALHHFTGEDPEFWPPFLDPYLEARGDETRRGFEESASSLHAVFHLRHADRFADLAIGEQGTVEDRRRWELNALDSWLRFAAIAGVETPRFDLEPLTAFPPHTTIAMD